MFTAGECLPASEILARLAACRKLLAQRQPEASGLLLFSRLSIYYLTGTLANGVFWLPLEGEALLLVRKGRERCLLESPATNTLAFRSYSELAALCSEAGSPLGPVVAAEMHALPWALGNLLQSRLGNVRFVSDDQLVAFARRIKSPWELAKMRACGSLHNKTICEILPGLLRPGMSERAISHLVWQIFFEHGHCGMLRMDKHGEDVFLGHVSAGENGNYPSHYNGPLGLKGEHPATPFMGHARSIWQEHEPLMIDVGFALEGYSTDKSQLYWSGRAASIPDSVRRAYELCLEIQARAAAALRIGACPQDLWTAAVNYAGRAGFAEGFMGLGDNKVQFLGHGIGLVIDEQPVLALRFEEALEENMVLAIEPKIGLPGVGMVGVENTFVVGADGGQSLTGENFEIICIE